MVEVSIDRLRIKGFTVEELVEKGFIKKLREYAGEEIVLVASLLHIKGVGPLVILHETSEDFKHKIVKIMLPPKETEKYLNMVEKVVKELA